MAKYMHSVSLTLASLFIVLPALAQDKDHMPERYKDWVQKEVHWIITPEEREAFYQIDKNELRDAFMKQFWERRDPTPGTEKNEYKEEHYKRYEYTNKFFGIRGQENGWRSERGRVWILLGQPKDRLEYANNTLVYPTELWFYPSDNRLEGVGFFYLIFFKRSGAGDYVLYHPAIDGPEELTWKGNFGYSGEEVTEAISTLSPELAQAARSLNAMDRGGNPLVSEMILAQVDSYIERTYDGSWASDFVNSDGKVDVTYSFKSLDTNTITLLHTPQNGRQQLHYAFYFSPSDLEIAQYEDEYYAVLEVIPSIANENGTLIYEDSVTAEIHWSEEDYQSNRSKPLLIADAIPIVPGTYTFTVRIRNKVSKNYFMFTRELSVPIPRSNSLFLTPPVLSYEYEIDQDQRQGNEPLVVPFKVFNVSYNPSSTNKFAPVENINVFTELYFPVSRNGEKAVGEVRFTFNIYKEEELVKKLTHVIPEANVNNLGVIYLNYPIPLNDLSAGNYRMEIIAEENKEQRNMVRTILFEIDDPARIPRPKIMRLARNVFRSEIDMVLANADQLMKRGFTEQAVWELERVMKQNPEKVDTAITLSNLLLKLGKTEESFTIAKRVEPLEPNNRELVLLLARASAARGDVNKAINYYERLLFFSPEDIELLNDAGVLYMQNGNSTKARGHFEKSLTVDPNQPEIKRMLDNLTTG